MKQKPKKIEFLNENFKRGKRGKVLESAKIGEGTR